MEMKQAGVDYRILVLPDHPTPIRCRTHTSDPVPFLLYDSRKELDHDWHYNERDASLSGVLVKEGYTLIDTLLEK